MPAISNKVADIPPDDYSWRKYGQKPIKGSPYPRYTLVDHSLLVDELTQDSKKSNFYESFHRFKGFEC